jgi:hypothetical protein
MDTRIWSPPAPIHLGLKEPFSFPHHLQRRSTSDDVRDFYQQKVELWVSNGQSNLAYNATSTGIVEVFYMPQICDMGPTALLPLRRKVR